MITGIEHAAIAAANAASLAEWYSSVLGFSIVYRSANAIFVRAADDSMIEIISADGERAAQSLKSPGLRHLALTVENFDEVYAGLVANKVNFVSDPQESKGNRTVFFTDPEGNYLHLLQRANPLV